MLAPRRGVIELFKRKIFIWFTLVVMNCSVLGLAAPLGRLEFLGVEKKYKTADVVTFKIKNESESKIYYGISVEKRISGQWVEFVPNILLKHHSPKPPFQVSVIDSKEAKKINWPSKSTPKQYKPSIGLFRFVLIYAENISGLTAPSFYSAPKIYSVEFEVTGKE